MHGTLRKASSPVVVTLLSPSPALSQSFKDWLLANVGRSAMSKESSHLVAEHSNQEDDLDRWGAASWNSVSINVSCNDETPSTTLLHLLSPAGFSATTKKGALSLLSIQHASSIEESRSQLAAAFAEKGSPLLIRLRRLFHRPIMPAHLLKQTLLQWNNETNSAVSPSKEIHVSQSTTRPQLKEIVFPVENMALQLPSSGVTGVYQCSSQLAIRPLPPAIHDRVLTVPTLVFHQSDQNEVQPGPEWHPIGFSSSRKGQWMQYKYGLDVRLCPSTIRESMFCEAQESMLAGSLEELQSTRVLGSKSQHDDDPRTNNMDCWVEVRANLKRPSGYFQPSKTTPRFAKAPDIPYE